MRPINLYLAPSKTISILRLGEEQLYDERALLLLTAEGNKMAFNKLFIHCWPQVYGVCLHLTKSPEQSKDLAQDIFLKLWIKREELPSVKNFKAYLYTISRNLAHDYIRTKIFRDANLPFLNQYFATDDFAASPQKRLEQKELTDRLHTAVRSLPTQLRQVFTLHRFEGLPHEEIAKKLDISPLSSKTYMTRALLALRRLLDENSPPSTNP
jgi:RNA polymerase sigma-70 factor (ECF subfamily)